MKTFAIHTLGCKVNSYESEAYIERCNELGYEQVDFKSASDLYLINTCAVTNTAASKSRQKIHQAISQNPNAYVAVLGCYSQSQADSLFEMKEVDAVVGSDQKDRFLKELPDLIEQRKRINYVHDLKQPIPFEDLNIQRFTRHTRAFLKIQDGCNQFCSYCIIPYTRGRERSLELERAFELAKKFVENGHHEIVLSGIHTGRYGHDHNTNLVALLKKLLEIHDLDRIRISSIEMNEVTDEFIALMKENPRIAHHLHIPVQSCSDTVLKRMNRPYDMKAFIKRIQQIRSILGNISISTDIITGFPEESDEEFEESLQNLEKIQFSFMHVFPYSKRDNTVASQMKQIHGTIKKQRAHTLNELSASYKKRYYESWINEKCQVLVETCNHGLCHGYTSEYIPVTFEGNEQFIGKCVEIRILRISVDGCEGVMEVSR